MAEKIVNYHYLALFVSYLLEAAEEEKMGWECYCIRATVELDSYVDTTVIRKASPHMLLALKMEIQNFS
jgi:hypothetical protein